MVKAYFVSKISFKHMWVDVDLFPVDLQRPNLKKNMVYDYETLCRS